MGSNSKAIEKSDEMLDMNPWEHQTESILDQNLNIYGSSSTEGRLSMMFLEIPLTKSLVGRAPHGYRLLIKAVLV